MTVPNKASPASGRAAKLPNATPSSQKMTPTAVPALKAEKSGVDSPAAASPNLSSESDDSMALKESVTKLMVGLLILATVVQGLFFTFVADTALYSIPGPASGALDWVMFAVYVTMGAIRALLLYFCCLALISVYHSLLFWDTPALPALTYPSWLEPTDARVAISELVTNGFWLLVGMFILRCSESLVMACHGSHSNARSSNLYGWVKKTCVDSPGSHAATMFAMLVAEFVISSIIVGVEIMLLMCLYGYSTSIASDEERELMMYQLVASSEQSSPPPPVAKPSPPPQIQEDKPKRKLGPRPEPIPEPQPAHPKVEPRKGWVEKREKSKPRTFTRIKSAFQIMRVAPQQAWPPIASPPLPKSPLPRPSLHKPTGPTAPFANITGWFGPPCESAGRGQSMAAVRNEEGPGQPARASAHAPGPTQSVERLFFKTPFAQLNAMFGAAAAAATSGNRAHKSKAAETGAIKIAARASSRAELEEGPRPTSPFERAQVFRTPGLGLNAQVWQLPAGPVGSQGNATATKERQSSPRALPQTAGAEVQSGDSLKQDRASGTAQEAEVKPYVQIRAMFETLRGAGRPDEGSARAPASAKLPLQTNASGSRTPWVLGVATRVERQLQQQMRSPGPHFFNVSAGIRQVAESDARPAGFNYFRLRGPGIATGPPLQLPPLLEDRADFGRVRPTTVAVGVQEATRPPRPFLPAPTEETARRPDDKDDGQQRPDSHPDPRLKALQSVLIKASFIPQAMGEAQPEAEKAAAERLSLKTGEQREDMVGPSSASSPPPPSVPPPPPPLPPPPPHLRRRTEPFFFRSGETPAGIGAQDMPTHEIRGGITQYRELPGAQIPSQAQQLPSSENQPPAAAPAGKPEQPQPLAGAEDVPQDAASAEAPQLPQKVAEVMPQAARPPSEPQQPEKPASYKGTPEVAATSKEPSQPENPAIPDALPQPSVPMKEPEQPQQPLGPNDAPRNELEPSAQ